MLCVFLTSLDLLGPELLLVNLKWIYLLIKILSCITVPCQKLLCMISKRCPLLLEESRKQTKTLTERGNPNIRQTLFVLITDIVLFIKLLVWHCPNTNCRHLGWELFHQKTKWKTEYPFIWQIWHFKGISLILKWKKNLKTDKIHYCVTTAQLQHFLRERISCTKRNLFLILIIVKKLELSLKN